MSKYNYSYGGSSIELPTIKLPDAVQLQTPSLPLPTADVPSYQPLVVPPSDLRRPEGTKEVQTEENPPPKIHFPPLPLSLIHI